MLVHPWDAALDAAEWQERLAGTDRSLEGRGREPAGPS